MKPLKGINMLGNCWLSSFSLKPFLINSQLITKTRDVMNKKLLDSRRRVDWEIRKCCGPFCPFWKTMFWCCNNRNSLMDSRAGRKLQICGLWQQLNDSSDTINIYNHCSFTGLLPTSEFPKSLTRFLSVKTLKTDILLYLQIPRNW